MRYQIIFCIRTLPDIKWGERTNIPPTIHMIEQYYSGNYSYTFLKYSGVDAMVDLAQNSPPKVKIPTLTIIVDKK